jgi:prophage antirepressor-like protein
VKKGRKNLPTPVLKILNRVRKKYKPYINKKLYYKMDFIKNFLTEKEIRTVGSVDEPWFVMKDVCKLLDIKDARSGLRILKDEYKKEMIVTTTGGDQKMCVINEPGFYMMIMRSNKPIVENFQKIVCTEVLIELRKTGQFKFKKAPNKTSQTLLKKCGTCLLDLPLKTRFYLHNAKNKDLDDPSVYRSDCKACCLLKIKELRKKLKTDPTHNKKTCTSCNELLALDLFYKKRDNSLYDDCISCYTKKNGLDDTTRQCTECKDLLSISDFHAHTKEVIRNVCKSCRNRSVRDKRYTENMTIVKCEFCEKDIYSLYIQAHQKTKGCLKKQGKLEGPLRNKPTNYRSNKIIQMNATTGDEIARFRSISEASKMTTIISSSISACCRGIYKTSGGFKWSFAS